MAKIAVYMTGSVAAFKAVSVVRDLERAGHQVRVAMTEAAERFVGPATLASLTHRPVVDDLWKTASDGSIPHVELADWADLALVVPASADVLAKMAHGLADDAVSAALLATAAPRVVVPAMNSHMWANPATQRNLFRLQADGVVVMAPDEGALAEGYNGRGRLPEPAAIADFVLSQLPQSGPLTGRRLVVTAGGTREPVDPVRFIGNRSSGKMGIAIARAAAAAGARVDLIVGQVTADLPFNPQIQVTKVETTEQMLAAVATAFKTADGLVMAAAVADFRPAAVDHHKIKKDAQGGVQLNLVKTPDILQTMGEKKGDRLVVGFAAESDHLVENAAGELVKKHADLIVANDITKTGSGFGADTNQVTILRPTAAPQPWPKLSKAAVADRLVALIGQQLKRG